MAAVRVRKTARKTPAKGAISPLARFPLRTAFVVVGVVGLASLGVALFGPRRLRDDFIRPITSATYVPIAAAVAPQADRVWAETRAWRDRVGHILESINTAEVRDLVAGRLAQWIERFR